MTTAQHTRVGWTAETASDRRRIRTWALVVLVGFIASGIAYAGFLTVGGVWFTISDAIGLVQAVVFVPLILAYDNVFRVSEPNLAKTGRWLGLTGSALVGVGSIILLTSEVSHEFVPAGGGLGMQLVGFGLVGAWFFVMGLLGRRTGLFGRSTNLAVMTIGVAFLVGAVGSAFGPDSIPTTLGFTVAFVGLFVWVFSVRRELRPA